MRTRASERERGEALENQSSKVNVPVEMLNEGHMNMSQEESKEIGRSTEYGNDFECFM